MIRLEKVNRDNVWDLLELRVRPDQKNFVADNTQSLVEAYLALGETILWPPKNGFPQKTPG